MKDNTEVIPLVSGKTTPGRNRAKVFAAFLSHKLQQRKHENKENNKK